MSFFSSSREEIDMSIEQNGDSATINHVKSMIENLNHNFHSYSKQFSDHQYDTAELIIHGFTVMTKELEEMKNRLFIFENEKTIIKTRLLTLERENRDLKILVQSLENTIHKLDETVDDIWRHR